MAQRIVLALMTARGDQRALAGRRMRPTSSARLNIGINEKRRWPQRKHFAVLIAERINRRFFNVIHLLSYSIPLIAVQVSLLGVNGGRTLHFTKLLNTYEEIEDGSSLESRNFNCDYWNQKAKWTLDAADSLLNATANTFSSPTMTYAKGYIAIAVNGYNYMRLFKRSMAKSLLEFRMEEPLRGTGGGATRL